MFDERRLIRRIQQGDPQAFAAFVDQYGGQVHRLVRRSVDNASDAEDVTQEIFCDLHRGLARFRGESKLSTWVYRVTMNHCLKHRQRQRPDTIALDEQIARSGDWRDDPVRSAAQGELRDTVQDAIAQLGPLHSDVVILCEMHGLTYRECADVLNIPVGTVKSRLSNAFRRLRGLLAPYVLPEAALSLPEPNVETIQEVGR